MCTMYNDSMPCYAPSEREQSVAASRRLLQLDHLPKMGKRRLAHLRQTQGEDARARERRFARRDENLLLDLSPLLLLRFLKSS